MDGGSGCNIVGDAEILDGGDIVDSECIGRCNIGLKINGGEKVDGSHEDAEIGGYDGVGEECDE